MDQVWTKLCGFFGRKPRKSRNQLEAENQRLRGAIELALTNFDLQMTVADSYAEQTRPEGHSLVTTWEIQNAHFKDIMRTLRDRL